VEETCDYKDIPKSRYLIENHECKFCDFNFILVDGKCLECPKNQKLKNTKIIYVTEWKKFVIFKIFINQDILLKIMNVSFAILILFWSMENVWNAL
jgi:hypothetical protein